MPDFPELVRVLDNNGQETIRLDGNTGNSVLGANGNAGDFFINDKDGNRSIRLSGSGRRGGQNERVVLRGENADIVLGGGGASGDVFVRNADGEVIIRLDGKTGEIRIRNWSLSVPDDVLSPDYSLRSLAEVSSYIGEHCHLPDIPSGEEVVRKGFEIGTFAMSLLRKVEELTLYILKQQEQLRALNTRISALEGDNDR